MSVWIAQNGAASKSGRTPISLTLLALATLLAAEALPPGPRPAARQSLYACGVLPLSFVANMGQTDPRAALVAHGGSSTLFVSSTAHSPAAAGPALTSATRPARPAMGGGETSRGACSIDMGGSGTDAGLGIGGDDAGQIYVTGLHGIGGLSPDLSVSASGRRRLRSWRSSPRAPSVRHRSSVRRRSAKPGATKDTPSSSTPRHERPSWAPSNPIQTRPRILVPSGATTARSMTTAPRCPSPRTDEGISDSYARFMSPTLSGDRSSSSQPGEDLCARHRRPTVRPERWS
jgi:hypothetical protein